MHSSVGTNLSFISLHAGVIARVEVLIRSKIDSRALQAAGSHAQEPGEARRLARGALLGPHGAHSGAGTARSAAGSCGRDSCGAVSLVHINVCPYPHAPRPRRRHPSSSSPAPKVRAKPDAVPESGATGAALANVEAKLAALESAQAAAGEDINKLTASGEGTRARLEEYHLEEASKHATLEATFRDEMEALRMQLLDLHAQLVAVNVCFVSFFSFFLPLLPLSCTRTHFFFLSSGVQETHSGASEVVATLVRSRLDYSAFSSPRHAVRPFTLCLTFFISLFCQIARLAVVEQASGGSSAHGYALVRAPPSSAESVSPALPLHVVSAADTEAVPCCQDAARCSSGACIVDKFVSWTMLDDFYW